MTGLAASLLARPVAGYIRRQRDLLGARAVGLSDRSKARMAPYFASADLDRAASV